MKKRVVLAFIAISIISAILCKNQKRTFNIESFNAIIIEKDKSYLLVSPQENKNDLIELCINEYTFIISRGNKISFEELKNGEVIHVIYNGLILEKFPGVIPIVLVVEIM